MCVVGKSWLVICTLCATMHVFVCGCVLMFVHLYVVWSVLCHVFSICVCYECGVHNVDCIYDVQVICVCCVCMICV